MEHLCSVWVYNKTYLNDYIDIKINKLKALVIACYDTILWRNDTLLSIGTKEKPFRPMHIVEFYTCTYKL